MESEEMEVEASNVEKTESTNKDDVGEETKMDITEDKKSPSNPLTIPMETEKREKEFNPLTIPLENPPAKKHNPLTIPMHSAVSNLKEEDRLSKVETESSATDENENQLQLSPRRETAAHYKMQKKLAKEEERAIKKGKELQKSRLAAIREEQNRAMAESGRKSALARLDFIKKKAEVFSRFLGPDVKNKGKQKKAAPATGRGRNRKTEEEEDAEMMQADSSGHRTTRLTVQPACIKGGTMRWYQLDGLNWLVSLYEQGINGILADEMGLGKTLQSISLLGYLLFDRGVSGPHIVIVPKSVIGNWAREFKRWCPDMRVIQVAGNKALRQQQIENDMIAGQFDVVLTTYEIVRIERTKFLKFNFRYLVMDEAHSIKNENSRLARTVRELNTQFRLLITGTPLQNNLRELWALLNFLLPEVFESAEEFEDYFKMEDMQEESVVSKLHGILKPFLIRRLKTDVEKDLPPKREIKLYTGMTEMQTYWYRTTLSRDVAALNQLGGPEKTRLLNILMQLRKVCNHPYLFQGAEPGPPYFDGPHLWENSGKMLLLDKLLKKLKKNGDRVLIFSQMTRLLDILEDYMRYKQYEYCRIDGQTSGTDRDRFMNEFNEEDSTKFVFLLSTRAGGLGINLQTANIVVLYDSDWNPQADLQAQDRAHRIGQKKEVTVFRFITEGTVEEKIVERAEKKLYLDAVVVQQGRLQQANQKLNKEELMTMVKFGADAIFKSEGATITDEDIDVILSKGENRTEKDKENFEKFQTDVQHNLLNFRLETEKETDMFMFEGKDYKEQKGGNFISLPTRNRRRNYDVNDYYKDLNKDGNSVPEPKKKEPKGPKGLTMHDFQFYNKEAVQEIEQKEKDVFYQRRTQSDLIKEAKQKEKKMRPKFGEAVDDDLTKDHDNIVLEISNLETELDKMVLPQELIQKKQDLIDESFGNWNKKEFRQFISACERNGRNNVDAIVTDVVSNTNKTENDVMRYHKKFWTDDNYKNIADYEKLIDKIERGEQKIARVIKIKECLRKKVQACVDRGENPFLALRINYGTNKGKIFNEDEDRFLICMMDRLGYGEWEQIKQEIRKSWLFRFDWFFKSRTAVELQRRGDTLIRLIEKE
eukprot:augustus_masked-scaffold_27-processed-gene-1.2-mRNA-1 protein AED:0.03 eAED:0.03 QI:0/-1/0/1/-1/1/1/0/1102